MVNLKNDKLVITVENVEIENLQNMQEALIEAINTFAMTEELDFVNETYHLNMLLKSLLPTENDYSKIFHNSEPTHSEPTAKDNFIELPNDLPKETKDLVIEFMKHLYLKEVKDHNLLENTDINENKSLLLLLRTYQLGLITKNEFEHNKSQLFSEFLNSENELLNFEFANEDDKEILEDETNAKYFINDYMRLTDLQKDRVKKGIIDFFISQGMNIKKDFFKKDKDNKLLIGSFINLDLEERDLIMNTLQDFLLENLNNEKQTIAQSPELLDIDFDLLEHYNQLTEYQKSVTNTKIIEFNLENLRKSKEKYLQTA